MIIFGNLFQMFWLSDGRGADPQFSKKRHEVLTTICTRAAMCWKCSCWWWWYRSRRVILDITLAAGRFFEADALHRRDGDSVSRIRIFECVSCSTAAFASSNATCESHVTNKHIRKMVEHASSRAVNLDGSTICNRSMRHLYGTVTFIRNDKLW